MHTELPTEYQNFIATSRYARWLEHEQRRETWSETVKRYFDFFEQHLERKCSYKVSADERSELEHAVASLQVMPSMRALMTAGPALERCNVAGYNCAYLPVDSLRAFDEAMYVLMCGTGVGFSVESRYVDKLPIINEHFEKSASVIRVGDSKAGWSRAYRELIALLVAGQIPSWDTSELRPAGARLKTFGGRASGPGPLIDLFEFTVQKFQDAAGRRLTPIECHDILCKVGEIVVVGGVRRSAMISLSDLTDHQMQIAKTGNWWEREAQRALANNSTAYAGKPDIGTFMGEWLALYESGSGERGIFNRHASMLQAKRNGRREYDHEWGTNPCSEIILRPYQFCNLTEIVVRAEDSREGLRDKARLATKLGTWQATLTNFKYLRKQWQRNTEEECLLGVSLTGIMDNKHLSVPTPELPNYLKTLRDYTVAKNAIFAKELGINQSTAITCVKPSGTVSQLVDSASGIHPRHSEYYIRTVRGDNKDPLTQFLVSEGVPAEPCVYKPNDTTVFSFPMQAPPDAVTRNELTAIEQLNLWLCYQRNWCEHKPSITVTVRPNEWLQVASWVYDHFDEVSGISFLPHSEHSYQQAPYQELTKEEFDAWKAKHGEFSVDWTQLRNWEKEDMTEGSQSLACVGTVCEVVDITHGNQ